MKSERNHLEKLYIEVTNRCNLDCRTCMRNAWEEPLGNMEFDLFQGIMSELGRNPDSPIVFFGGIGEPLSHPDIIKMVQLAKETGCRVEMISNGILLNEDMARELMNAGIDCLWVSIDGAHPNSYSDVRLGDHLPEILENLEQWKRLALSRKDRRIELGISFVALKRNIQDLPEIVELALHLQAQRFSLSNVEAYTKDLYPETLYPMTVSLDIPPDGIWVPRFDNNLIDERILSRIRENFQTPEPREASSVGVCPFASRHSLSIRWDGMLSPCLPLLHSHTVHFQHYARPWPAFHLASLRKDPLNVIRESVVFREFIRKLQDFSFAPCLTCNGCDLPSENGEDCFGNVHPACGGCLWAQGFIVCP